MIRLINPSNQSTLEKNNGVYRDKEGNTFFIVGGALRLVKEDNYTSSFGFQWNKFAKTQIDREIKNLSFSRNRFFAETNWDKEDLSNKDVLEVGSGAGRFTQIVLQETKANLYSIDYSDAVTANYKNNGHHGERLKLFQASIYEMPFPDNSFDKVFCFGVLQHTPDFKRSVKCLIEKTKPGGEIVVDFYSINGWWTKIHAKYLLRPFTKKVKHDKLLALIEKNVGWLMKLYFFFEKIKLGKIVNRFLPICDIHRTLPQNLSKEELKEWVILDTFDIFSPEHDHPQKISTVRKWFEEFGVEVSFAGFVNYEGNKRVAVVKGIKR
ncbi:MAG TPA: class I SAM-dependent methyltransferase [Chitinophagaceae bacterium]|jgi:SAM-dependent methyltransferase|nr:class I SAM-dependent methyltransferase [Chitinophagaceae bacterium]